MPSTSTGTWGSTAWMPLAAAAYSHTPGAHAAPVMLESTQERSHWQPQWLGSFTRSARTRPLMLAYLGARWGSEEEEEDEEVAC